MPRKRYQTSPPSQNMKMMNIGAYDDDHDHNDKKLRVLFKVKRSIYTQNIFNYIKITTSLPCLFMAIALIVASLLVISDKGQQSTMMKFGFGYIFIARPVMTAIIIVFDIDGRLKSDDDSEEHTKRGEVTITTRIIALSFLMSILCNQFPRWLSALVACFSIFVFGLASRQQQKQSTVSFSGGYLNKETATACNAGSNNLHKIWSKLGPKERAALAGLGLVVSMLTENFLIWVVSATYEPGINGTSVPLQDNGRIVLEKLAMKLLHVKAPWMAKRSLQTIRNSLNVQWALVASFSASLVCLELQLGQPLTQQHSTQRSLGGLTFRALSTLATARIIRTISFALTVLPSQVPNCYASHFPAPPENWSEWLMVGFLPNTRGGCNDLILSGHATVTSTIACALTSVASNTSFSIAVWTLVALDYGIEAYQGLHYSVDMWLGCIVTCLLWHLLHPLEFEGVGQERRQHEESRIDTKRTNMAIESPTLDTTILVVYAVPATLSFVILTVVPVSFVNYFLIGYSIWAAALFARNGFTIYVQHILICELCFGLGAYL